MRASFRALHLRHLSAHEASRDSSRFVRAYGGRIPSRLRGDPRRNTQHVDRARQFEADWPRPAAVGSARRDIFSEHIVANGKTGQRIIKLNQQAQEVIKEMSRPWNYKKDYVSHKFKKEARKVGINDIRFHDLRRTFGYNLIKQGKPIYEVSKLLGHSSVITTERHYAPLLTIEIDDFVL